MAKFKHPSVTSGQITHDGQSYPIVDGVVELPDHVEPPHGALRVVENFLPTVDDASPPAKLGRGRKARE